MWNLLMCSTTAPGCRCVIEKDNFTSEGINGKVGDTFRRSEITHQKLLSPRETTKQSWNLVINELKKEDGNSKRISCIKITARLKNKYELCAINILYNHQ